MTDPTNLGLRDDADRRTHVERINGDRFVPAAESTPMTPEQFEALKALLIDLLTPGYELSTIMLGQYKADQAKRAEYDRERAESAADRTGAEQKTADQPPPCPPAPAATMGPYATADEAMAAKGDREIAIVAYQDGSFGLDEPAVAQTTAAPTDAFGGPVEPATMDSAAVPGS